VAADDDRRAPGVPTRRERIVGEIYRLGVEQVVRGGPDALSIRAIATELGLRSPSLYRYVVSREQLLSDIVFDSYEQFARTQEAATAEGRVRDRESRFRLVVNAWRTWGLENPNRHRLLFSAYPGATELRAARVAPQATRGLAQLLAAVALFDPTDPPGRTPDQVLADQIAAVWTGYLPELENVRPSVLLQGFRMHTRLVGLVSLEIDEMLKHGGIDLARLWDDEVEDLLYHLRRATGPGAR
jgi:AcrR family transcriptional regulator